MFRISVMPTKTLRQTIFWVTCDNDFYKLSRCGALTSTEQYCPSVDESARHLVVLRGCELQYNGHKVVSQRMKTACCTITVQEDLTNWNGQWSTTRIQSQL
ncbi:hypothetical protein AVEN_63898-1 [Araneus ventricosus]|uniref:Uncharacterized protein n=1 Tax=Araneus ventricosus TaxID=182803 RepID=A0A4Y2GDR4_ARAVE|nr:hypothetical protein AVEN_63898-1 [Araneus ventricosus]